ncbi:MAG: hypothetical protein FWC34_00810 [Bacteroidetes bacterium]|nr:hypothetical protein [Bacteroidota bacterium]
MVLQTNNYKIIKKVTGTATGTRVLCLFGGYQRPLVEKARSQMLESANLIGKSRAVINETIEVNNKFFLVVGFKTVTVSAYVIEFTNEDFVEDEAFIITPAAKETSLNSTETVTNSELTGKWLSNKGEFEITFYGSFGAFSKINSGMWLRLLQKGKIKIDDAKFKNITKTGELTWSCHELERSGNFLWLNATLTLNKEHNKLTVSNRWYNYPLSKVEE